MIEDYIKMQLALFRNDPADSDFQKGFEACLLDIARQFKIEIEDVPDYIAAQAISRFPGGGGGGLAH